MKKKFKLGIIGAGFMSSAIVEGIISSKTLKKSSVIVSDKSIDAIDKAKKRFGINVTLDNSFLCENSEFILFAVKPQSFLDVINEIKEKNAIKIISIMAGVKKEKIKESFKNAKVARAMPNTPCSIGSGAIGIDLSDFTDKNDVDFIKGILSPLGVIVEVKEEKLNAVTGISGSAPAYFYLFLKGIIDAGVSAGLSYNEAKTLAVNTLIGSGKMVQKNADKNLDELISAVCSKGGTTIEAIKVYTGGSLNELTDKAVKACIKRSTELENL